MFQKVLIANRGEIACRIARTCKRLGVRTVAVYSEADAGAPHVRAADEAILLGPAQVQQSYLNVQALISVVRQSGADAVHPGYGLLSENAEFARAVAGAGVAFVGPSPDALSLLGDKVQARRLAQGLGFEPPPGSGEPVTGDPTEEAQRIGFPVLLKAAAGGGGIGMVRVTRPEDLARAAEQCRARALAAFGDDRIYVEKYLERPRHIEVQLLADMHGNIAVLGERECSVQRRHQKVIEESPSPGSFIGELWRAALFDRARRLLEAAKYVGAATVETVVDAEGHAYFLEVNARLQVEHPVTELCTGLDLVEWQLRIAAGEPLGPEVRTASSNGHAIEARLYAEDPDKGFAPQPGTIERFVPPQGEGIRVDTGIESRTEVTPYYDPLLAKIAAWGPTRAAAIERLLGALGATEIVLTGKKGPKNTNLALLMRVLEDVHFTSGGYDTHLLEHMLGTKPPA
jgi:acetyl/propionyl-CoA carboxylase alpha subunit